MIFQHTSKERGLWRGWLKNGQSVEVSVGRHGWEFGSGIHVHSNDSDMGSRMLFLKIWRLTVILPLGIVTHPWPPFDGPQWSAYGSSDFGLTFCWGMRRKSIDWPWSLHTLAYEQQMPDGSWGSVFDHDAKPFTESHSYTYVLRSGVVQKRQASISKRRHILCRRAFKAIGWPVRIKESIDVEFDGEVGERTGSWKGGCLGCGYDILPGETPLNTLRRMEKERKF